MAKIEKGPEQESVTRDQVVAAFRALKNEGVENPWDQDDKKTEHAWKLYEKFNDIASKDSDENKDPKAPLELNQQISIDMIIGDAGFEPDEDNLDAILDFLEQDLAQAEKIGDKKFVADLREKIEFYNKKLKELPD
jgi:hypothetical protein